MKLNDIYYLKILWWYESFLLVGGTCICCFGVLIMCSIGDVNAVNRLSPVEYLNSHITDHANNQESYANE